MFVCVCVRACVCVCVCVTDTPTGLHYVWSQVLQKGLEVAAESRSDRVRNACLTMMFMELLRPCPLTHSTRRTLSYQIPRQLSLDSHWHSR